MNTKNELHNVRLLTGVIIAILFGVARIPAQSIGLWDFNSGNLSATAGATLGDLAYADGAGGATDLADAFGTTTSFGIPNINGTPANVLRFPGATGTMGYNMPNPATANGGGSFVNDYTLIFDLLYPSNGIARPLLDTDGNIYVIGAELIVNATGGLGLTPNGPFDGTLSPNTWYRVGFVVTQGQSTIRKYINGVEVGVNTLAGNQAGVDARMALTAGGNTLILADTVGAAGLGYVNSIQLRDAALNAGQMEALGGPSAAGIPQVIPPVPSFVQSRTPGLNATAISPRPNVTVVLHQGDTTINSGSIQLSLDGANLPTVVTPTSPTFTATASVTTILDPNSVHTLRVVWTDSVAGAKTNAWSFTVQPYQIVTLPAPFYLETFDGVPETAFPTGWYETNNTQTDVAGLDLTDPESDSYKSWVVITTNTLFTAKGAAPLFVPAILVNGEFLTAIANDKLCYAESDSRGGSQVQMLFATNINCTARSNIYLSFHSIYAQNQDNIASVEYSINGGATWLPALYMLNDRADAPDIIRTNGVIDVGATYNTARADQAYGLSFGTYIGAPVSTALIPFTSGRIDDNLQESIRVELIRLPQADNQANVSLRFMQAGTASWWFGVDDVGLYEVNTPVITGQPQNRTISATETTTFTVTATSSTALSYQWQRSGTNISNSGHYSGVTTATLTVSNADTSDNGSYRCRVSNSSGPVNSSAATLTVIDAPLVTVQPVAVLVSAGFPASLSVTALGRPPLSYQWYRGTTPVGGNSSTFSVASAATGDSGQYTVVITNVTGAATSSPVALTVVSDPISGNLVVHLKFENNYNDSSSRGNNATAVGAPGFGTGKIGQAFRYTNARDGSSFNYATLSSPPDLLFGATTDFSVSYWSRIAPGTKVGDPPQVANKNWNSGGNIGFVLGVQGGNSFEWNYREEAPSARRDFDSQVNMVDDQWHHVVATFQRGGVARTFIDGVLRDTRPIINAGSPPTTIDAGLAVNIGQDGTGTYTDGGGVGITNALIDDVGIWRRLITPEEAVAIYNAGNAGLDLQQAVAALPLSLKSISADGTDVVITWQGGNGPFLVQGTGALGSSWVDLQTTSNRTTRIPRALPMMFLRVRDGATNSVALFQSVLNGANERPNPVTTPATGIGLLALDGLNASYWVTYSGLTSASSAAHVHGPADATATAGPIFGITPVGGFGQTAGVIAGTATVTAPQAASITSGNTYFNIHTSLNGGGEIRGQLLPVP